MKFKRCNCKFCNRKLVMWKLIDINPFTYFPICYSCADVVKTKLAGFDTTVNPVKKEVLLKAKIVRNKIKPPSIGYGN